MSARTRRGVIQEAVISLIRTTYGDAGTRFCGNSVPPVLQQRREA